MSLVEFCCHFSFGRCRRHVQLRFDHVLFFLKLLLSPNIEKFNTIISNFKRITSRSEHAILNQPGTLLTALRKPNFQS